MAEKKTTEREREKKDQERREFESRKYSGRQLAASGYSRAARSLTERCGHQKNSFGTRNRWPLVAMCGPFWSSSVLVRVSFSSMSHTRAPPPPSSQTVGPSDASAGLMLITPTDHTIQCHGESHWLLARKAGSITAFRHLDLTVHNVVSTPSITLAGPSSDLVINGRDEEAIERVRILRDATAGGGGRNEYTIKKQQQKPRKTTPTVCAAAETTSIWKWNQRYKRQTSGTEKKRNFCFLRVASDARVFFLCFLNIFNFPWFFLNAQGEGVDTLIHWLSPMTDESASLSTQRKKEA